MMKRASVKEIGERAEQYAFDMTDANRMECFIFGGAITYLTMLTNALTRSGMIVSSLLFVFIFELLLFGLEFRAIEYLKNSGRSKDRYHPFYLSWVNKIDEYTPHKREVWTLIFIKTAISFISTFSIIFFVVVNILTYMIFGNMFFKMIYEKYTLKEAFEEVKNESEDIYDLYINFFKHVFIGVISILLISIFINKKTRTNSFSFLHGILYMIIMAIFMKDILTFVVLPAFHNHEKL